VIRDLILGRSRFRDYLLKPSPTIPLNDPVSGTVRVTLAGPSSNINRWCMGGLYSTNVFGLEGHAIGGSGRNDANDQTFSVGPLSVSPLALIVDIAAHDTGPLTYAEIQVNNTGTLGGTGSVGFNHPQNANGGRVTVNSGGTIAPGESAGTLTLKNGLTLNDGSKLAFELGATSDLLRISGGTFTGSATAGGVTVFLADLGALAGENTYDLIDFEGATPSGVDLTDFPLAPGGPFSGGTLAIVDNTLQVTVNPRVFQITRIVRDPVSGAVTLTFPSASGSTNQVEASTDLATWQELDDNMIGQPVETDFLDTLFATAPAPGKDQAYYRVTRLP